MIIGMELGGSYGTQADSWRAPGVDPAEYLDYDARIKYAQAAERGKLQFLFFPGGPHHADIENTNPIHSPDLVIHTALLARATERIGFVASALTNFHHPYTIAQQFKTLDFISNGRAAWNAVASGRPDTLACYGSPEIASEDRYGRAYESIELVQSLWGSWGRDAWVHDQETGQFTKPGQVGPVNFEGKYVTSRGPLYIPPSKQGQPVIAHSGLGPNSFAFSGRYADLHIGSGYSIDEARGYRDTLRRYAAEAGRDPDEVKYVAGRQPTVAPSKRQALDRRASLVTSRLPQWVPQLGELLGVPLTMADLDRVLEPSELVALREPSEPGALRAVHPNVAAWMQGASRRAQALASEGWSVRDILAQGVFDQHPAPVGTATEVADHMQEWFESGAIDGFWVAIDVYRDGIDTFVDEVIPILQDRGLFHKEYEGATLRENLGVRDQYGPDYRVAQTAKR